MHKRDIVPSKLSAISFLFLALHMILTIGMGVDEVHRHQFLRQKVKVPNVRSDWMPLDWTIHAELVVRLYSEGDSSVPVPTAGWIPADCVLIFLACL